MVGFLGEWLHTEDVSEDYETDEDLRDADEEWIAFEADSEEDWEGDSEHVEKEKELVENVVLFESRV